MASRGRGNALALIPVFTAGALVSISRQGLNTGDLPVYVEGFLDHEWNSYYLREALFWAAGRGLTQLSHEPRISFAIADLVLVAAMTRVMGSRMSWPLAVLLCAFPTMLGFTNIYRQLCASVLMMGALRELWQDRRRGTWLAIAACTIHIAMIGVCLSLLWVHLLRSGSRRWLFLLIPLTALLFGTLLPGVTLMNITGGTENRGDTAPLYIVLGALVHTIAARTLWTDHKRAGLHWALLLYFTAGAMSLLFAPDSTGSRVMMISIHLTAFITLANLGPKPRRWMPVALLAALLIGPLLISTSAWHLIFAYDID